MQQHSTLKVETPQWKQDLDSLPPELQSVLHSALSAVIQQLGPDAAEEVVEQCVWEVWRSRHATYMNMMTVRMAFNESRPETVEEEMNRRTDEAVVAMDAALKTYYS